MGMGNIISSGWSFTTNLTDFGHDILLVYYLMIRNILQLSNIILKNTFSVHFPNGKLFFITVFPDNGKFFSERSSPEASVVKIRFSSKDRH